MSKQRRMVTDLWIYKWRYWLGYAGLAVVFGSVIAISGFYAPGGLHQAEVDSAIHSAQLQIGQITSGHNLTNLPFTLIQKASISLLGLSNFSIKLPAILFAGLAVLAFFRLLSIWTTRRAAILASLVMVVSSRLVFLSQFGTPLIALITLPLLAVAILVQLTEDAQILSRRPKLVTGGQRVRLWVWLISLATIFSGLLYLPMGGFMVFIIVATIMFHPSVRLAFRGLQKILCRHYGLIALGWAMILLAPIFIGSFNQPDLTLSILGVNLFNLSLLDNLKSNLTEVFFYQAHLGSPFVSAWFSLSALVLTVIGIIREIKTTHQSRSAMILMWMASGLILAIFSAESHILLFTPLALSIGIGLNYVITSWYKIFPRNPYARFFGLIPILMLIVGLVSTGIKGYIDNYLYHPLVAPQFTNDLQLLNRQPRPFILVASQQSNELTFYQVYARSNSKITVTSDYDPNAKQTQIVTAASAKNLPSAQLKTVLTNRFKDQSDRFYVYKKATE